VSDKFQIAINGDIRDGFKSISVERTIDSISGAFSVTYADISSAKERISFARKYDQVLIIFENDLIMNGVVDALSGSASRNSKENSFSGRDKTGQLVDCSVEDYGERKNISLIELANSLTKPFDIITLSKITNIKPFPVFKISPGESVFQVLDRATRLKGFLLQPTTGGNLEIVTNTKERAIGEIKEGVNLVDVDFTDSGNNIFSKYTILGQQGGQKIIDAWSTKQRNQIKATAVDNSEDISGRFRPKVIVSEGQLDLITAKDRAEWEAATRNARGISINCTVQGWAQDESTKKIWKVGTIVNADIESIGQKGEYLISGLVFDYSEDNGSTTSITLTDPNGYIKQPILSSTLKTDSVKNLGW